MKTTNFKSYGLSQTFVGDTYHDFKWDADYSGKNLNIALSEKINGEGGSYFIQLTPDDLSNLLAKPASNQGLEERLNDSLAGLIKQKKRHTKKNHKKKHISHRIHKRHHKRHHKRDHKQTNKNKKSHHKRYTRKHRSR